MADKVSILVIDDDPDTLYTLGQICRFKGWTALLADGYLEAETILANHTPSLILVDYHMPVIDGVEAVIRIRKKLRHTPILILTSDEQLQLMEQFMVVTLLTMLLLILIPNDLLICIQQLLVIV